MIPTRTFTDSEMTAEQFIHHAFVQAGLFEANERPSKAMAELALEIFQRPLSIEELAKRFETYWIHKDKGECPS